MLEPDDHPVATGLGALVGVTLVVGLVFALMAVVATQVFGLGGGSGPEATQARASLYVPSPQKTKPPSGPLVTLEAGNTPLVQPTSSASATPSASPSASPQNAITLRTGQQAVAPMERIYLTGDYPGGQGAVLQVQRLAGGSWTDFPVTVGVSGPGFSTYIETGQSGENRFRVLDPTSGRTSNVVRVRVG